MKNLSGKLAILLVVTVVLVALFLYKRQAGREQVSRFGEYRGYSEPIYDGTDRSSGYMALENGTRLAYDLILPTRDGVPADEPLPVLFKYTPYLRTFTIFDEDGNSLIEELYELKWYESAMLWFRHLLYDRGHLMDPVFRTKWLGNMLAHGYAVIVVERPGTGASFGVMDPSFDVGANETDELLDWIAAQEWCDGNIGMYGDSWQAMIQFAAASTGNPHLKAIFPISSAIDNYSAITYPGGVYNKAFGSFFSWSNSALDALATPVDSDRDGALLAQARQERSGSTVGEKSAELFKRYPFHDSVNPGGEKIWEGDLALYPLIERINQAGVPIYMTNGWYDLFTADMFLWYTNLTVPRRLIVRPLDHSQMEGDRQSDLDYETEVHRWFDYWLKGIDNGIMGEPPIHYYVMGAPKKDAWQTSEQWPLRNEETTRLYFADGEGDSHAPANVGSLRAEPPDQPEAHDVYVVDYSTTTGEHSRWSAVLYSRDYPDMRTNDEKALTYTTPPLEADVEVSGHPIAHLWLATGAPDLDVFVYLEEVSSRGRSTYITEGNLRASHRTQSEAPFDNLSLPYHSHYESELAAIPSGEPVEMVFDLLPTSYLFREGNRIRITVAFADADNFQTAFLDPPPEIRLLRDADHASFVDLPIIVYQESSLLGD